MINLNKSDFSLENKNILITGASSGIGRQIAIKASQYGAHVILIARNEERLKETFNLLYNTGHFYISEDISNLSNIGKIVENVYQKVGVLNGFIHSAGIDQTIPLRNIQIASYDSFRINFFSAIEFIKILTKKIYISSEGASIVLIASVMGFIGSPAKTLYSGTKGALISAAKSLALELSTKRIRVNCISPAFVKTPMLDTIKNKIGEENFEKIINMHPLGLGEVTDIANASIFLLSDASRWITGTNLVVDGGYSAH